jgi:hypothetical protein
MIVGGIIALINVTWNTIWFIFVPWWIIMGLGWFTAAVNMFGLLDSTLDRGNYPHILLPIWYSTVPLLVEHPNYERSYINGIMCRVPMSPNNFLYFHKNDMYLYTILSLVTVIHIVVPIVLAVIKRQ